MRSTPILAVLTGWLLAACGGDYCDRRADLAESCDQAFTDEELESCDQALKECSRNDEKLLDDYADCLEDAGLLVCEGTDDEAAFEDYMTCASSLLEVSDACFDSLAGT